MVHYSTETLHFQCSFSQIWLDPDEALNWYVFCQIPEEDRKLEEELRNDGIHFAVFLEMSDFSDLSLVDILSNLL